MRYLPFLTNSSIIINYHIETIINIIQTETVMKKMALLLTSALLAISAAHAAPEGGKRPDFGNLCQGKALNTKVNAKHDDRTIEGTCQMGFKANNPSALERGAMRDPAVQNACKGKAKGAVVNAKVSGKNVAGKCDVTFRPNMKR